ncbi:lipase family protein [Kocuria rhizophila]|uniref:lipase family protein n=2 Tax=Kocuria rhizophila TaxID=72000 RepID=UPI0004974390|nr:lipase family protein [Kocuria rhizophila]MCT2170599.1 lipase family protein [Kocuria rhizophila]MDN3461266.1 alpha/beta fold hydrolase [Kocuria sp. APC 4018]
MAPTSTTARPMPLRRSAGALALGIGLLLTGLQSAHAETPASPPPVGGFSELPRSAQGQALQEEGLTWEDVARGQALQKLSATTGGAFYETPAQLPATDGDVVRSEASTFYLDPVKLIKPNASSTRIMYKTTNSKNQAVPTTGTVLESKAAWKKASPRPLVVLSPGTQGMGDPCAPSRQLAMGMNYEGTSLAGLVNAGYNVVVPDYIGLGTEGTHTYMNRVDQGHAVLDAVRAAQRLGVKGMDATTPVAAVGYSQGGGATASAVEMAPQYAPELKIKSAWVGAPPADLVATGKKIDSSLFTGLSFYVMGAAQDSGVDVRSKLNVEGQKRYDKAQESCVIGGVLGEALVPSTTLTADGRSFSQLLEDPELKEYLKAQDNGAAGRHPAVPVRVAHGLADDVVPYQAGRNLAKSWCTSGTNVSLQTLVTPTHLGGYVEGIPSMLAYLDARFNGIPQTSSCWRL